MKNLETYSLYNGEVKLLFSPGKHQYFVGESQIDGCTGILSALGKPAIPQWAVNTCLDFIKEKLKPGQALDEIELKALLDEAKYAHTRKRDKAGDIGTMVHAYCEDWIKGKEPAIPFNDKVRNGANAFLDWVEKHNVKFTESERKIYSRRYRYAGTLDAEGLVDGKLSIIDFKTGSAIYPEMRFQTAAYEAARREESGLQYTRWIIRLGKDDGEFEAKEFGDLDKDFSAFLGIFDTYKRLKVLKEQEKNEVKQREQTTIRVQG